MSDGKQRGSFIYDPKVRSLFFQILLLLAIFVFFLTAILNANANLAAQGKKFGFDFLNQPSSIRILTTFGTWITGYQENVSRIWTAFWVGIANTLIVAFAGIIAATVIGFVLGVFRLSKNFILRSFATVYIETLRNIPLLLQIFFWNALVRALTPSMKVADSITLIPGVLTMNSAGVWGPYPDAQPGFGWTVIAFFVGLVLAIMLARWAKKRQELTGQPFPSFWAGLGVIAVVTLVTFFVTGRPMIIEMPVEVTEGPLLKRGQFESGIGSIIVPEFISLFLALSTYTAAFIAEIVRAGINSVPKGQTEAVQALGISPNVGLRKVILPQALRVIIPPLTSQYLNLTKNSSLAAAIGYPELVALFAGTTLNQTGRAIEIIGMVILVYLVISLITSLFMNWFNARMKIIER